MLRRLRPPLHILFFLSGAAALAYEVLWMRRFSVLLGATAPAVAAALTAFFIGLGFGSYLLGRLAPRLTRPLRVFAALELLTALSALAVEPFLRAVQPAYAWLYDASGESVALRLTLSVVVAVLAVLVPATCMGGTLPVLAQFVAASAQSLGVRAGGLYAVNTLGAACGALTVPVVLLPYLGAPGALAAAVTASLVIAAGALLLARAPETRSAAIEEGTRPAKAAPGSPRPKLKAAPGAPKPKAKAARDTPRPLGGGTLALAFLSGAITLALEALATRAFALVHENSVYSFATVVAVFLAGLGSGAALARAALQRGAAARGLVAFGWAGAGAWMVVLPALFVRATGLDYLAGGRLFAHEAHLAALVAAALLAPSFLLGLVLPALMEEEGQISCEGGPAVGSVLAANTAGAIVGPLLALFALAPATGLWTAVSLLGALSIACAGIASRGAGRAVRGALAAAVAIASVAFLVVPPGSLPPMKLSGTDRLLDLREGPFGSVAVVEHEGHRRIKLNNFYVLGGSAAAGDERLQGHIPLLLHPRPERVAYLGLGTGISLSAIRFHPVREVLALELVPEVVSAARDWFGEANHHVLDDPRVRIREEDARSYVAATRKRFDVVVGDLVVPWRRGESSLYTRDSFEAVRRVLAPGGLYCQWVPLYQISETEFDSIAASFLDVFPRTTLWRGDFNAGQAVVALVGHTDTRGLDARNADARTRALAAAPDRSNPYLSHPAGLWLYCVGPLDPTQQRFRSAPRNRDASPWVELASPRLHLRIASGEAAAFVARPLKARLDEISSRPLAGTAADSLQAEHLEWRERGADIWEASLLSFEGDNAAADRLGLAALAHLPAEIQAAVMDTPGVVK
ncbi:MAG TPA: methyltransferase domain-containing protein [Vicinamibacterales bacterium]|nr:methyltransferase domain-containing protein [Vicinamibacterales bacterium]